MDSETNNSEFRSKAPVDSADAERLEPADDVVPTAPDGFSVHDHATANWVVRKIVETRQYRRRVQQWAELEIRRAEREEQFFMMRFGRQLEDWVRGQITEGKSKSVKLPAGVVGYRTEAVRLEITDETTLIAWCRRSLPDALRVETHVVKSLLSEYLQSTGECPDGTDAVSGGQKFYVR